VIPETSNGPFSADKIEKDMGILFRIIAWWEAGQENTHATILYEFGHRSAGVSSHFIIAYMDRIKDNPVRGKPVGSEHSPSFPLEKTIPSAALSECDSAQGSLSRGQ
jgi:hypothetical protein